MRELTIEQAVELARDDRQRETGYFLKFNRFRFVAQPNRRMIASYVRLVAKQ
jgi:hypothetical protein